MMVFGDSQYQYFFDDEDLDNVRALTDEFDTSLDDSKLDPWLFLKADIYLILHVDDMRIAYKEKEALQNFLNELKEKGLQLAMEESFNEYLGIQYDKDEKKQIHLKDL